MADAARAPAVLKAACERYGFFYLANHGVPLPLVEEVRAACRRVDGMNRWSRLSDSDRWSESLD